MPSISTPAAIIGGSVLAGGIGAVAQSNAASTAAGAQEKAASQAIAAQQQMFGVANQNLQPYIQTGNAANSQVAALEGLNGGGASGIQSTLEGLPGYQFANSQGLKSVQNSATARGLGLSGAAQKGAANYSTGLANQYYNNYLTGLQTTVGQGAGAAESLAGNATQVGGQIGQNITASGQAAAQGALSQGAAISNAAQGVPNALITNSLLQNIQGGGGQSIYNYDSPQSTAAESNFLNQAQISASQPFGDVNT